MSEEDLDVYGDSGIESKNAEIAWPLKLLYLILPILGIIAFFLYWDGSHGWFDRGYWQELQKVANTRHDKVDE